MKKERRLHINLHSFCACIICVPSYFGSKNQVFFSAQLCYISRFYLLPWLRLFKSADADRGQRQMEECGLMKNEQRWPRSAEGAYIRSQALTSKVAKIRIRRKSQKGHISITRHYLGCTGDFIPSINWFSTFYLFFFFSFWGGGNGSKGMHACAHTASHLLIPHCWIFCKKIEEKISWKVPWAPTGNNNQPHLHIYTYKSHDCLFISKDYYVFFFLCQTAFGLHHTIRFL